METTTTLMDPVAALESLGGIAGTGEWRRLTGRAAARDALEDGRIIRIGGRRVGLPDLESTRVCAAALGATISHLSAAQHHGWKVKVVPPIPTLTVPRSSRGAPDPMAVELHWADLPTSAVEAGVTTPVQTVVDCARAYAFDVALCVADSALRSGLVRQAELSEAAGLSPRTGRAKALRVANAASALADNPFESVLRAIALSVPGLDVRPQGWVGNAGRSDLVDDVLRIAIEADSWEHHGHRDAFKHDVRRYAEFARRGWVVLRFLWEDVMHNAERVRRVLLETATIRAQQLGVVLSAVRTT